MNTQLKKYLIPLLSILFLAGCSTKSYLVKSDKNPKADLGKYKKYDWTSHAKFEYNTKYTLNDYYLKNLIKEEVGEELEGLGYEKAWSDPDILVSFLVVEEPTEFTGYGAIEEDDFFYDYWFLMEKDKDLSSKETYQLDEGTLLVQMIDAESGQMVWQGYASGIMDKDVFDRDENNIEEAVELIFEKFDARSDEYSVGQ